MVCGKKRLSTREKFKGDLYWKQCWYHSATEFSRYDTTGARRSWGYCLLAASIIRAFGSVRPAPLLVAQCKQTRPYCLGLYLMLLIYYWCSVIVWPLISDTRCSPEVMHKFLSWLYKSCCCNHASGGRSGWPWAWERATSQSPGASACKLKCSFCK